MEEMKMNDVIARINELARKAKAEALTPQELAERDKPTAEQRLDALENTYLLRPDGTKQKLEKKK